MSDLKFALRQLGKAPAFTVTALATIAICLGANLAIFAVIDSILLRPLPFPQSDRLVTIYNTYPKAGVENDGSSITNYYERRGNIPAFSSLSLFRYGSEVVGETGAAEQTEIMRISPEFFTTLGSGPVMGRSFNEAEAEVAENNGVAIVTDAYWHQRLNSDPNVLGRDIRVNTMPRKIVGVLPPDFRFLSSEARIFLPIRSRLEQRTPTERHSGGGGTHMIARLKPGATIAEAQAQIDAHNAAVEKDNPEAKAMAEAGFRSPVFSLHADHVRSIRPTLWLMQGGVFFLLLIGAVNLVNLLLIRASGRAKEMAIRQSMGASRRHVVTQVMVETILLTFCGGLLGVIIGAWGLRLLEVLGADRLPLGAHISFDGSLAAIGLLGAVVLGVLIAVPIAWFNLGSHLANALQSESRTGTINRATQRLRHGFIVAQIALAFVLLAGAALLGLSLKKAMAVSPGFRADYVLTGEVTVPFRYNARPFLDRLLEAIGQQPGVGAAGAITNVPLSGESGQGAVYLPFADSDGINIFVVIRTSQRPEAFAETLRKLVRVTNPDLAIDNLRSMETRIAESLIARRSPAMLAGIFAGVALLLAAIGTYGVLSYAVAQRQREIGIRMALGAQREQIGAQFLSLGLRLLVAGTLLGLFGTWLAGKAMQTVLFDVSALRLAIL